MRSCQPEGPSCVPERTSLVNARHLAGFLHQVLDPRPRQPISFRVAGPDVAGRAFRGDQIPELTVVAHSSASSKAAERLRLALIDGAARLQSDAWRLTSPVELLETPANLDGEIATFLTWATRAADGEWAWAAGYLRRGRVTWELLASAAPGTPSVDLVTAVAIDLVSRDLPTPESSLWDLLPVAADLPVPMQLDATLGADPFATELVAA